MIENLLIQNFISIPSPIFRRSLALQVNGMDEKLWYTADWDFWLKIAVYGKAVYYPKPLSGFRIHTKSQTVVRSSYEQEFRNQLEQVYKKHWNSWKPTQNNKNRIRRAALFSIEVNTALAGYIHRKKTNYLKLIIYFLSLGPYQAYRYLKASRIAERVTARLKANLISST
jgi:hypothetical protein